MLRRLIPLLASLALLMSATLVHAAPLDDAANKKIDEAVNQHYLATSFNKAESVLLGTLKACGERCSADVKARAWMYVGIVRGSGKGDLAGAKTAFDYAVYLDPKVRLDAALATPETKAAFRQAKASGGSPPPELGAEAGGTMPPDSTSASASTPIPTPMAPGERPMECTPKAREVETRRPIPMQCTSSAEATRGEIRYKEYGGETWQTARMVKKGAAFQGTIPCAATGLAGRLDVHVVLLDEAGNVVDHIATRTNPMSFTILNQTDSPPPAFPDQPPPARCAEEVECPPDFPGCHGGRGDKVWGDSCEETYECRRGLVCLSGRCENASSCDSDADCDAGQRCVAGMCESEADAAGPFKQNWIGLHVAQDFVPVSGDDVCSVKSQSENNFACFTPGGDAAWTGDLTSRVPGQMGKIDNVFGMATTRVLASYDRAFSEHFTAGLRLGWAFRGGPTPVGGSAFMPLHGELRAAYYFIRLRERFRPYVGLAGGVAQVDTKITNVALVAQDGQIWQVEVWKKTGQAFGALSAGFVLGMTDSVAAQINLNAMALFPSFGLALQPSLGVVVGL